MHRLELIAGPPRCGKSLAAETRVLDLSDSAEERLYVATLPRLPEFDQRIAQHRRRRRDDWRVIEISRDLSEVSGEMTLLGARRFVLLDGISAWIGREIDRQRLQHFRLQRPESIAGPVLRAIATMQHDCDHLVVVGTLFEHEMDDDPWITVAVTANELALAGIARIANSVRIFSSKEL